MDEPALTQLQETLPNFPEEVLEDWLMPYAKSEGWPPFPSNEAVPRGRWAYLLLRKSQTFWTNVRWSPLQATLTIHDLEPKSQDSMMQMILAAFKGEENLYSIEMHDLKPRVQSAFTYLCENGRMPGKPTLLKTKGGYRIMDGNHRMAAYLFYNLALVESHGPIESQAFWVGVTDDAIGVAQ